MSSRPKPTLKTRWTLLGWYVHAFFYRLMLAVLLGAALVELEVGS